MSSVGRVKFYDSAQMIAVAEQQQEVLRQEGRDSEPIFARIICAKLTCGDSAQMVGVASNTKRFFIHIIIQLQKDKR